MHFAVQKDVFLTLKYRKRRWRLFEPWHLIETRRSDKLEWYIVEWYIALWIDILYPHGCRRFESGIDPERSAQSLRYRIRRR